MDFNRKATTRKILPQYSRYDLSQNSVKLFRTTINLITTYVRTHNLKGFALRVIEGIVHEIKIYLHFNSSSNH